MKSAKFTLSTFFAFLSIAYANNSSAEESCQLQQYASIPITLDAGHNIFLPVTIEGTEFQFMLHSGTFVSRISHTAAGMLDLTGLRSRKFDAQGVNGEIRGFRVTISEMKLGSMTMHGVDFAMHEDVAMSKSEKADEIRVIGGENFGGYFSLNSLKKFDVEIDLHSNKINLFSTEHCDGAGLYWAERGVVADIDEDFDSRLTLRAILNGKELPSELNTGAAQTMISWRKADELGISRDSPGVIPVAGAPEKDALSDYVLQSLQVGGEKLSNFPIKIRDFRIIHPAQTGSRIQRTNEDVEVSIGVDFLMLNRIYIAPREHKMYFTPYNAAEKKAIAARGASN